MGQGGNPKGLIWKLSNRRNKENNMNCYSSQLKSRLTLSQFLFRNTSTVTALSRIISAKTRIMCCAFGVKEKHTLSCHQVILNLKLPDSKTGGLHLAENKA
jgi:hypothetical protein